MFLPGVSWNNASLALSRFMVLPASAFFAVNDSLTMGCYPLNIGFRQPPACCDNRRPVAVTACPEK